VSRRRQCTIVETYKGEGHYFTNAVTEIVAGDGAVIDHYKVQRESLKLSTWQPCRCSGRSANFTTHNISSRGALVRNYHRGDPSEGAEATVNGLYCQRNAARGQSHRESTTQAARQQPRTLTRHSGWPLERVFNGASIVG